MRDINKTIANIKIPTRYQLTSIEWAQLGKEAREPDADATLNAVLKSFKYGFALGQRAERARRKKTA